MRSPAHVILSVITLAFVASVASAQDTPAPAQTREAVIQQITVRGTVEAIDHTARTVRVRGDQGNISTWDVPANITRFDSMAVGDVVTITYYDRVNVRLKPAGEPDVNRVVPATTTANPGLLPNGVMLSQHITTVTIDAWDPATRTVTFRTPTGTTYTRHVNDTLDPGLTAGLVVGDRVDVTRTDAMSVQVDRPVAQTAQASTTAPPPLPPAEKGFNRYSIYFLWGPDSNYTGQLFQPASGTIANGGAVNVNETAFSDIYSSIEIVKLGFGFRSSPRSQTNLNFVWSHNGADQVQIGTIGAANAPMIAQFDAYNYWGIEGGQRWYFTRIFFAPFLGYNVGINKSTAIFGRVSSPAVGSQPALEIANGEIFDNSWMFSAGPTGGLVVAFGPIEVQMEIAARYMSGLNDIGFLDNTNLNRIGSETAHWSVPFLIGAGVRF